MKVEKSNIAAGDVVKFRAQRIRKGNPVKGLVLRIGDEWMTIELFHAIEGMVNVWDQGEEKEFRLCLIDGEIEVTNK